MAEARGLGSVLSKTLREQRRALLWWSLGIGVTGAVYSAFYPSIVDFGAGLSYYVKTLPEVMQRAFFGSQGDFVSPAGYLQTEVFGFFAPLLLIVYAVGAGSRAIAGEEERGSLDLLLSTPTPRRRVVVHTAIALVIGTAVLAVALWVALVLIGPAFDLRPSPVNVGAACVMAFLVAALFGMVALAAGAMTGARARAIGVASAIAGGMWVLDFLAPSVDALAWLQKLSAFSYYDENLPVKHGLDAVDVLVLATATLVVAIVAVMTFERRDLAT